MAASTRTRGALLCGTALLTAITLSGCSAPADPATAGSPTAASPAPSGSPAAVTSPSGSAARTATPTPSASLDTLSAAARTQLVPSNLTPSLRDVAADVPVSYDDGCHLSFADTGYGSCTYGADAGAPTVMLVGDSHAAQWLPALQDLAAKNSWRIVGLTKSACPATTAQVPHPTDSGRLYAECAAAHKSILARIAEVKPDLVVTGSMTSFKADQDPTQRSDWYTGIGTFAQAARDAGAQSVLVLGDTAHPTRNVPECLSSNLENASACAMTPGQAISPDNERDMAKAAGSAGAGYAATSAWTCGASGCPVIVGDLLVYRDDSHLTTPMARWLAPLLEAELLRAAPSLASR